jgi:hypothetical protein
VRVRFAALIQALMAITAERDLSKVGPNQVRRIEEDRHRHFSFMH